MSGDYVRFYIGGEVTVARLSDAFARFSRALDVLGESHRASIEWVVTGLMRGNGGNAGVVARAVPLDDDSEQWIPEMHNDCINAAARVSEGVADRAFPLDRQMHELLELADEDHPITIESNGRSVEVDTAVARLALPPSPQSREDDAMSLGTVRGRVETSPRGKAASFSLYELATGSAVRCSIPADAEGEMSRVRGRVVDVTGTVGRDTHTGKPISIRDITHVEPVGEGNPDGYLRARGVINSDEPAETLVRRMRNDD